MKSLTPILASITLLLAVPASSLASTETPIDAHEIMQQVKNRDDGNNVVMDMNMTLIDADGTTRERLIRSYRRDDPERPQDSQSIMFFLGPANVKDTGFLTFDFDDSDKDDDQWLYLPALKKVKRIASSDKSGSFMGSDFTYADMSSPNLNDYDYSLMKETEVDDIKVWQILSTPKTAEEIKRTGYSKSVAFVRQDNFVVVRSVNWLEKGNRLKFMEVKKLAQIDGIWTSLEIVMSTKKGKITEHASVLRWSDVKYNQTLDDDLFSQRRLSLGL